MEWLLLKIVSKSSSSTKDFRYSNPTQHILLCKTVKSLIVVERSSFHIFSATVPNSWVSQEMNCAGSTSWAGRTSVDSSCSPGRCSHWCPWQWSRRIAKGLCGTETQCICGSWGHNQVCWRHVNTSYPHCMWTSHIYPMLFHKICSEHFTHSETRNQT